MGRKNDSNNRKYKVIEGLLYASPKNKIKIANLKLEVERVSNCYQGCTSVAIESYSGNTYKITSSVENEVIAKEAKVESLQRQIRELEIQEAKIENALSILSPTEYQLIKLQYFKHYRNKDIAQQLTYSEPYYAYLKKRVLDKLIEYVFPDLDTNCMLTDTDTHITLRL